LRKLAGTPSDFHPHGISLYRAPDGTATLMAINHRSDGRHSVDIFTVKSPTALEETGSIQGGQLVSPNAVAALDSQRFYVTNDHASETHFGRQLDDDLVLPRANVLYFDGNFFRVAANDLAFPSGAALSPDGRYLYVGEAYGRRLTTYERSQLSGALTEVSELAIPTNLDNLRLGADGVLWVGSHPKAFAMTAWRGDASKPAPSQIFKVTLKDGIPQSATAVYGNLGGEIGGSSVGAVSGHRLLIGSPFDDHILDCAMDH
jgi:arylesterase/paraoxonase